MDRNSAIGLTLIAVILMAYFYWFAPQSESTTATPASVTESVKADSATTTMKEETVIADSVLEKTFGSVSAFLKGEEKLTELTTEDITISLSSKGAIIKSLTLSKYKTYFGQPLTLVDPTSTSFKLLTRINGEELDLYSLYYNQEVSKQADTTIVTYTAQLADNATIKHTYKIPNTGYEILYSLSGIGVEKALTEQLAFEWNSFLRPLEKDLADSRNNTTITWYQNDSFDELTARSTDTEREVIGSGLKWISVKQKFFLTSIIANGSFASGEIEKSTNVADSSVVKRTSVKVPFPSKDVDAGTANYKFYIGPNDYQMIGSVTEAFQKNVYLGWPPVYWINKFVIFPLFNFLSSFIGNFGLIIIILVVLIRLILLPLSYRSYLSMAKMKVLKPELDEIKEKHGDDMTKVQQEQLKLYQQVGVNPISGCVPLLLQMPILFAMFYLFPNSIELRQQSFLWAEDLSTYDSIINLPFSIPFYGAHVSLFTLLMTVSTLVYTWQNNQISSVQGPMKSMSYIMPLVFLFVLNSFPSGLSFYYFVSNLITFAQQAIIRKFVDDDKIKTIMEENRKRIASGSSKKSKFMSKLEEAMKASEESRRKAEEERKKRKK